ncbi:MAG: 50S ribosomal protein L1 [Hadesarchaea archaeon YNP_N21]|jgi:large subunit ribosomal protein L1|nr:MAG: 50S ribosomal protein L1 [Hadesarchaea archaeon YNP_N21]
MPIQIENLLSAIKQARETGGKRGFTQTFELSLNLKDIDLKKPESRISEEIVLPRGIGRPRKVAVFAEGELARKAKEAGADIVLGREEIESMQGDKKKAKKIADEYHYFLAQADLMPSVGKFLGAVLGPRGKMPRPIPPTADPAPLIERGRKVTRIRLRDQPTINLPIGVESLSDQELAENAKIVIDTVERKLEKGFNQIASVYVKTTMGKPVKVEVPK